MYAKKSLGQNFLRDKNILKKIVDGAKVSEKDTVLEVGPGEGTLTEILLQKAKKIIAVEKDDRLIPVLKEKFSKEVESNRLEIIHSDILEIDPSIFNLHTSRYKIVANLPYYITGQFLRKFLSLEKAPQSMTLLLQKEVADRIIARDRKESILSISVKAFGKPIYIDTVKAGSFVPAPKVDSAIISIENISRENFARNSEESFFEVLKAGFSSKRKMVLGNLKNILPKVGEILNECGINPKSRAEELSVNDWLCLSKYKN